MCIRNAYVSVAVTVPAVTSRYHSTVREISKVTRNKRRLIHIHVKSLHESCRMGRHIVVMKLISWLGHCEFDGHTVHKVIQRRLTADWLAPRESECPRVYSKISSDWLPSYIKVTWPVLEIFKMTGYLSGTSRSVHCLSWYYYSGWC
jgi:hypothetical protein